MSLVDDHVARTPRSRELVGRATASLPGGMGAIPTIATAQDIDDLAEAIGSALVALGRVPVAT